MLSALASTAGAEPLLLKADFGRTTPIFARCMGLTKVHSLRAAWSTLLKLNAGSRFPSPDSMTVIGLIPMWWISMQSSQGRKPIPVTRKLWFRFNGQLSLGNPGHRSENNYRLGESIEHTRTKRFVHPPGDMEHWAEICLGTIRHYTEGWANGFDFQIPYWEIWNGLRIGPRCGAGRMKITSASIKPRLAR